jgi:hypothetical protein
MIQAKLDQNKNTLLVVNQALGLILKMSKLDSTTKKRLVALQNVVQFQIKLNQEQPTEVKNDASL